MFDETPLIVEFQPQAAPDLSPEHRSSAAAQACARMHAVLDRLPRPSSLPASTIQALARDMAHTPDDQEDILWRHGVTEDLFEELKATPVYRAAREHAIKAMKEDPHQSLRQLALTHMPATVNTLATLVQGTGAIDAKDRIKAALVLADIAGLDAGKTPAGQRDKGASVAVQINFGEVMGRRVAAAQVVEQ